MYNVSHTHTHKTLHGQHLFLVLKNCSYIADHTKTGFFDRKHTFCPVFRRPFKNQTIWQLDIFGPFEYQTCSVFRLLLDLKITCTLSQVKIYFWVVFFSHRINFISYKFEELYNNDPITTLLATSGNVWLLDLYLSSNQVMPISFAIWTKAHK